MIQPIKLDDKPYQVLLAQALARIPALTEAWTDFNPSDTGILLLEACAALTEAQIYRIDHTLARPYERYLDLVCPESKGQPFAARTEQLTAGFASALRAVTPEDYERLALMLMPEAEEAHATQDGVRICLTVRRKNGGFSQAELLALREKLEPYRLLTTVLVIRQKACVPAELICRVKLETDAVPENIQTALEDVLRLSAKELANESADGLAELRAKLLSVPGVLEITELSVRQSLLEQQSPQAANGSDELFEIQDVRIGFD